MKRKGLDRSPDNPLQSDTGGKKQLLEKNNDVPITNDEQPQDLKNEAVPPPIIPTVFTSAPNPEQITFNPTSTTTPVLYDSTQMNTNDQITRLLFSQIQSSNNSPLIKVAIVNNDIEDVDQEKQSTKRNSLEMEIEGGNNKELQELNIELKQYVNRTEEREKHTEKENQDGLQVTDVQMQSSSQDLQCKQIQENQVNISKPTAKEEAAAKAARIRLGYEQPSEEDSQQVQRAQPKLPGGQEPQANIEFQYVTCDDLTPLQDPLQTAKNIGQLLTTTDWLKICDHINCFRSLAVFNKEYLTEEVLTEAVPKLLKYVKNPRSSVCKNALICVTDLISSLEDQFVPFLDTGGTKQPLNSVLATLLMKASANDKKFVTEATQDALNAAATYISPEKLLELILPYTSHRNPKVRGQAAILLYKCLQKLSSGELQDLGMDKILNNCGNLICDKTQEARDSARQCIPIIKEAFESAQIQYIVLNYVGIKQIGNHTVEEDENNQNEDQKENQRANSNFAQVNQQQDESRASTSEKQNQNDESQQGQNVDISWEKYCCMNVDSSVLLQVLKIG
eukprot:TRINITY_DN1544_c0_g1_i1.p1 TRINITY_DN1544_c0_g1~~TRINITY_DN1544_c0_g1_i1.p1  ORF type:complete len:594 (-),score=63.29 TRINITY_DN1544_c0_g1_i1:151-1842(-)